MSVVENKFPNKNFYIEPLGSAWAVYSFSQGAMDRFQEEVFTTLDEARRWLKNKRTLNPERKADE